MAQLQLKLSGGLLARNTLLNLIGQAMSLAVGVVTIPFIVRGLGTERFRLLPLAEQTHDSRPAPSNGHSNLPVGLTTGRALACLERSG